MTTPQKGRSDIRIIGGQWKRTRLDAVPDLPGLRPTPDRVRETLFNWLGQDLTGWRCLDAFAGTGALGLEAASRGAAQVLLVEQDARLVQRLRMLCQRLKADRVYVQRGDGVAALQRLAAADWDLVLLDPPFAQTALFQPSIQAAAQATRPGGFIYLEADVRWNAEILARSELEIFRHLKAGAMHAHLLHRTP